MVKHLIMKNSVQKIRRKPRTFDSILYTFIYNVGDCFFWVLNFFLILPMKLLEMREIYYFNIIFMDIETSHSITKFMFW